MQKLIWQKTLKYMEKFESQNNIRVALNRNVWWIGTHKADPKYLRLDDCHFVYMCVCVCGGQGVWVLGTIILEKEKDLHSKKLKEVENY